MALRLMVGDPGRPLGLIGWKEILKEENWVSENWKFRVGNGPRIRFWIDHWSRTSTSNQAFPTLFELASNNQETIVEVWDQMNGQESWNLSFATAFNDWELDMVANLLDALQ